jgi:endonuclease/exonuclease/phosphatase family metal-dependent hydrolase
MRLAVLSSFFGALATLTATASAKSYKRAQGSITLVNGEPSFTFDYETDSPNDSNWIGIYTPGTGPVNGESPGSPSAAWDWAGGAEGRLFTPTSNLAPGIYEAYFLADGGYVVIGESLEVELTRAPEPLEFVVDSVTLKNGREGDEYEADVSGLLVGGGNNSVTFSIQDGSWVQISKDGVLSGTPSASGTSEVTVVATASNDTTLELAVSIPVVSSGDSLVTELTVLTYNLWHGGTQMSNYHAKQVRFLAGGNFDIVIFQESTGDHATRLGNALGWNSFQSDGTVGVISRYPIAEVYSQNSYRGAVRVALDGEDSQINVWGVHLGYTPYGPYDFCFDNMTIDQVLVREDSSNRGPQIRETVGSMKDHLDNTDSIPVILAGDFNAPSHLDWTDDNKHCGVGYVPWPTSDVPTAAGLIDSYRVAHPDAASEPGITWSPIYLENNGRPEPLDRIDFVYYKGDLDVVSSEALVVGEPKPMPNHVDNEWTSDHEAVVVKYKL